MQKVLEGNIERRRKKKRPRRYKILRFPRKLCTDENTYEKPLLIFARVVINFFFLIKIKRGIEKICDIFLEEIPPEVRVANRKKKREKEFKNVEKMFRTISFLLSLPLDPDRSHSEKEENVKVIIIIFFFVVVSFTKSKHRLIQTGCVTLINGRDCFHLSPSPYYKKF